jgi:hypothetical protein
MEKRKRLRVLYTVLLSMFILTLCFFFKQPVSSIQAHEKEASSETLTTKDETTVSKIPKKIAPRIGNLMVDVDIAPEKKEIESGTTASYILNLKVTGAKTKYTNAKVVVTLPPLDKAEFKQDLNELVIAGVTPAYDGSTHTLTYEFPELIAGQAYRTVINVLPPNGTTDNNTKLSIKATLEADGLNVLTDTAEINVIASLPISVTKSYVGVKDADASVAPAKGQVVMWKVKVSVSSKKTGLLYLGDKTALDIKEIFTEGLTYQGTNSATAPKKETIVSGFWPFQTSTDVYTWTYNTPTIAEQEQRLANEEDLFSEEFLVYSTVGKDDAVLTNKVDLTTKDVFGREINTESNEASVTIVPGGNNSSSGTNVYYPIFKGPADGKGETVTTPDTIGLVPVVTDAAKLKYNLSFAIGLTNKVKDANGLVYKDETLTTPFPWNNRDYKTIVEKGYKYAGTQLLIDPNLNFEKIIIYHPIRAYNSTSPKYVLKKINISLKLEVNSKGNWITHPVDVKPVTSLSDLPKYEFSRASLGLVESDQILSLKVHYENDDGSLLEGDLNGNDQVYFSVKKGFEGTATNKFMQYGFIQGEATPYYRVSPNDTSANWTADRSVKVVQPENYDPVGRTAIEFSSVKDGNIVQLGKQRVNASLTLDNSSQVRMNGPLNGVILLPKGVTLTAAPNVKYSNAKKVVSENGGSYSVITDDYQGTGQQLIKVNWTDKELLFGESVGVAFDVNIAKECPANFNLYMYGFSGDETLNAPKFSGNPAISDSISEVDKKDLNGDKNTTQNLIKSGKNYKLTKSVDVQTEKLVKGSLDANYSKFGHTVPEGDIFYQLKLMNTTGDDFSKLVLMDVLPSVGDSGITSKVSRGTAFTPSLTGPITLPDEWQDKVTVHYSSAKTPKIDDLTKNVNYPETTEKLTNASSAVSPNWQTESSVTDWTAIHSFKVELKAGVEWVSGKEILLNFQMKAPAENELSANLLDPNLAEQTRAAWNSFAFAVDDLQVVEPEQVGVVIEKKAQELMDFEFIKENPRKEPLADVEFKLYSCKHADEANHTHDDLVTNDPNNCWDQTTAQAATSGALDGKVRFTNLVSGEYMLVETKTLPGYNLPLGQWLIQVDAANAAVTITGKGATLPPAFYETVSGGDQTYHLPNYPEFVMPEAGGNEVILLVVVGVVFIGLAAAILVNKKEFPI